MRRLLSNTWAYVLLQRALGADRLRTLCIEIADIRPGETVVDVGCGPAYYFGRLRQPIDYHGFDTSSAYVQSASRKWLDANFHLGAFDASSAEELGEVDVVLLLGVLHHLPDSECHELLALAAQKLSPDGRVVSVDTCFDETQGRMARWMSEHDRGQYVRTGSEFVWIAQEHFASVEAHLLPNTTRFPGTYWMMALGQGSP